MKNIIIEKVSDINSDYPYLEVFLSKDRKLILEVSITERKELSFKYYPSKEVVELGIEDMEYILSTSRNFLPRELENEEDILNFLDE